MGVGPAPVTAIVTAHRRIEQVLDTLRRLLACVPPPAEVLVHVDANERACADAIGRHHPGLQVIVSSERVGPGGGRNRLVAAARHELIASFDDDSYPLDGDYFARVGAIFEQHPAASVVTARVFHLHEPVEPSAMAAEWTADFSGGACAYRRSQYLRTGGYVPLATAYGMEEVDFSLRLHALGGRVLKSDWLRVCHHTDLSHHSDPQVTAASISNIALLAFLRYPPTLWGAGVAQCLNRIQWLLRHGRRRGVLTGIADIPRTLARHRQHRRPLSRQTLRAYWALRRRPVPA